MPEDNHINKETKEKMQNLANKLFILTQAYTYFCNSIESDDLKEKSHGLPCCAKLIQEYIGGIQDNYSEIQDILNIAY